MNDCLLDPMDLLSHFAKCFSGLSHWVKKVGGTSSPPIGEELLTLLVV